MCMMSRRETIILTAFPSCSLEYVGHREVVLWSFLLYWFPYTPRILSTRGMGKGRSY